MAISRRTYRSRSGRPRNGRLVSSREGGCSTLGRSGRRSATHESHRRHRYSAASALSGPSGVVAILHSDPSRPWAWSGPELAAATTRKTPAPPKTTPRHIAGQA